MNNELKHKRILIIDDEELMRELLTDILEDQGATVLQAQDGEKGQEMFFAHEESIDYVISDLLMPNVDGMQLYYAIREKNSKVKIVLSSGYSESDTISAALSKDSQLAFLRKPYVEDDLLRVLS